MKKVSKTDVVDNTVVSAVEDIVSRKKKYTGTMTELLTDLTRTLGKKRSEVLPGSPAALRVVLNRVINRLRYRCISVKFTRATDRTRTRLVKFVR